VAEDGRQGFHLCTTPVGFELWTHNLLFWGPRVPDYRGLYHWAIYHLFWLWYFLLSFKISIWKKTLMSPASI
jgi:hypothetical protein